MVELIAGHYIDVLDHSMRADWTPSAEWPFHATRISQASVVSWKSASPDAAFKKARHFRGLGRLC